MSRERAWRPAVQRSEGGELFHRTLQRAVQVGGEARAHGGAHFLFGVRPQGNGALEEGAAGRRRDQLVTAAIARSGTLDQAAGAIGVGNIRPGVFSENTGAALAICATVPTPTSDTSFTEMEAAGLAFFRSWMSCARSSME